MKWHTTKSREIAPLCWADVNWRPRRPMRLLTSSYLWAEPWHKYDPRSRLTGWRTASYASQEWPHPQDQRGRGLVYCFRSKVSERMCYEHFKIIVYVCRYGPYLSRVFLLHQLWIVNYYIKSSPNNVSNENINQLFPEK